jgi:hypothetical protein
MQKPVHDKIVEYVASLLTEDPSVLRTKVLNELGGRHGVFNDGSGRYEAEEVSLDEQGTMGTVVYEYTFDIQGDELDPDIELSNYSPVSIIGYDYDGNEIDATPSQMETWRKNAMDQFPSIWSNSIEENEYRKVRGIRY